MRRYPKEPNKSRNFILACILIVFLIILSVIINISLRPIIFDMANQAGRYAVQDAVNSTVNDIFNKNGINYSELVRLVYNDYGCVTAVEYNYNSVNSLKLKCSELLTDNLNKLRANKVNVPIGNIFGDISSQGRGPKLRFKFSQSSVPEVQIISMFESCGINQTKHEIRLVIEVFGEVYIPPQKSKFSCKQEYILASTIVVGDIPSGYAEIK